MSEQKHTGGTWVACQTCIWEANAARIVSCVNALEGVEDPQGAIEMAREAMKQAAWSCAQADLSNTHGVLEAALAALTPNPKDQ